MQRIVAAYPPGIVVCVDTRRAEASLLTAALALESFKARACELLARAQYREERELAELLGLELVDIGGEGGEA